MEDVHWLVPTLAATSCWALSDVCCDYAIAGGDDDDAPPHSVVSEDGSGHRAADTHDIPIKLELQRSTGAIKDTRGAVFRTQCSWPTRYPVHSYYADGFPALRARTNIGADSLGLHHYRFGSCDAATEADAQRQYATLSNCCDALVEALDAAAAGGGLELPHDALHAFRTKLEEHLCYWRPPPRPKQKAPGRPRGVGSHGRTTLPERNRLKAQQPGARSGRWTEEEHAEFLRLHAIHGRKWTLIAEEMPFRTEPQIRSHAQKHYLRVHQREAQAAAESAAAALGVSLPAPVERRRSSCSSGSVYWAPAGWGRSGERFSLSAWGDMRRRCLGGWPGAVACVRD